MAKTYIQPGRVITLAAPYQRNPGEGALVGAIFGVSLATVANAVNGEFAIQGVFDLAKAVGAITQGALVYWDNSAKNVTTTSTSNTRIGCATVAAQSGDATVRVRLNGIATPTGA